MGGCTILYVRSKYELSVCSDDCPLLVQTFRGDLGGRQPSWTADKLVISHPSTSTRSPPRHAWSSVTLRYQDRSVPPTDDIIPDAPVGHLHPHALPAAPACSWCIYTCSPTHTLWSRSNNPQMIHTTYMSTHSPGSRAKHKPRKGLFGPKKKCISTSEPSHNHDWTSWESNLGPFACSVTC